MCKIKIIKPTLQDWWESYMKLKGGGRKGVWVCVRAHTRITGWSSTPGGFSARQGVKRPGFYSSSVLTSYVTTDKSLPFLALGFLTCEVSADLINWLVNWQQGKLRSNPLTMQIQKAEEFALLGSSQDMGWGPKVRRINRNSDQEAIRPQMPSATLQIWVLPFLYQGKTQEVYYRGRDIGSPPWGTPVEGEGQGNSHKIGG